MADSSDDDTLQVLEQIKKRAAEKSLPEPIVKVGGYASFSGPAIPITKAPRPETDPQATSMWRPDSLTTIPYFRFRYPSDIPRDDQIKIQQAASSASTSYSETAGTERHPESWVWEIVTVAAQVIGARASKDHWNVNRATDTWETMFDAAIEAAEIGYGREQQMRGSRLWLECENALLGLLPITSPESSTTATCTLRGSIEPATAAANEAAEACSEHRKRVQKVERSFGREGKPGFVEFYRVLKHNNRSITNGEFCAWKREDRKRCGKSASKVIDQAADQLK